MAMDFFSNYNKKSIAIKFFAKFVDEYERIFQCRRVKTIGLLRKTMDRRIPTQYPITGRCVMCSASKFRPINDKVYALPFTAI